MEYITLNNGTKCPVVGIGTFITGTDLLIDGGVIAAIRTGMYKLY